MCKFSTEIILFLVRLLLADSLYPHRRRLSLVIVSKDIVAVYLFLCKWLCNQKKINKILLKKKSFKKNQNLKTNQ